MGDFNAILYDNERHGGASNPCTVGMREPLRRWWSVVVMIITRKEVTKRDSGCRVLWHL